MSGEKSQDLVTLTLDQGVARVTLNRPERRNSLTPPLLEALIHRLDELRQQQASAVVIAGAGRSFSSGGDVAEFACRRGEALATYADQVVSLLNIAILKTLKLPIPVIVRLHGFVTGGSAGFLFASDFVVIAEDAYIAPYYTVVGFSPDGGWTALLPERIGGRRSLEVQIANKSISAVEAVRFGLASCMAPAAQIDQEVERILLELRDKCPKSIARTKRLVWTEERIAKIARDLDVERRSFVERILEPDVQVRMDSFLNR
ncbi:MAG: enoyl-CoA hydratase/isomerase family protein [Pseudomonadota bacterium]